MTNAADITTAPQAPAAGRSDTSALPTFNQPSAIRNPHADQVERHIRVFADRIGVTRTEAGKQQIKGGYGYMVAWTYPEATYDDLCIIAEWTYVAVLLDDLHSLGMFDSPSEWAHIRSKIMAILYSFGAIPPLTLGTPFVQALADLARRTRARTSQEFYLRLISHLDTYCQGCAYESETRLQTGAVLAPDSYMVTRRLAACMYFAFDMVELSQRVEVPMEVYTTRTYRELTESGTDVCAWQNDILSLDVEDQRGDKSNFVVVLQHAHGLTRQDALQAVIDKLIDRIAVFTAAEQRLPDDLQELGIAAAEQGPIRHVVEGMRQWTNGFLQCYNLSSRYKPSSPTSQPEYRHTYLLQVLQL